MTIAFPFMSTNEPSKRLMVSDPPPTIFFVLTAIVLTLPDPVPKFRDTVEFCCRLTLTAGRAKAISPGDGYDPWALPLTCSWIDPDVIVEAMISLLGLYTEQVGKFAFVVERCVVWN